MKKINKSEKARMFIPPTPVQYATGNSPSNQTREINKVNKKGNMNKKGKSKLSLYANDITFRI